MSVLAGATIALAAGSGATVGAERHYELVTPADKNGTDVQNFLRASPSGDKVAWISLGAYGDVSGANAEVPYVASRASSGNWTYRTFYPPYTTTFRPGFASYFGAYALPDDFRFMVLISRGRLDAVDDDRDPFGFGSLDIYRVDDSLATTWLSRNGDGPPGNEVIDANLTGMAPDGSAVFFTSAEPLLSEALGATGPSHLYRWDNGELQLVGRAPGGALLAGGSSLGVNGTVTSISSANAGDLPDSNAVSSDGERYVYGGAPQAGDPRQVYLRRNDGMIVQLSLSQRRGTIGQPSSTTASFVAAVGDLRTIFIRSADQLTDDAPPGGGDYRYDVSTGELRFSNADDQLSLPNEVGGFVRASEDAEYVYFVSRTVLAPGAADGTPNLYVRGPQGVDYIGPIDVSEKKFTLVAGNGEASAPAFTSSWLSADGTKFVYQTRAEASDRQTNGHRQIYLYDALERNVRCVSCDPRGGVTSGDATIVLGPPNIGDSDYTIATPRAITRDGARVVFVTEEGLVPKDDNGVRDVYEFESGAVSLVSTGTSAFPSLFAGMSDDGTNLFFMTRSSLVGSDADNGLVDIYNARLGPPPPHDVEGTPCAGDDCQRSPSERAGVDAPATTSARNDSTVSSASQRVLRSVSVTRAARVAAARTGVLAVRIDVASAAHVRVLARARIGRRDQLAGSAARRIDERGRVTVYLRLNRRARSRLSRSGQLRLSLSIRSGEERLSERVVLRAPKTRRSRRVGTRTGGTR